MTREPKYPVQTVMKAIEIINLLAKEGGSQGLGISEFSKELEMGKSTVHRLLDTLQFYGYIEKDEESSRYRLGWELYKIGQRDPPAEPALQPEPQLPDGAEPPDPGDGEHGDPEAGGDGPHLQDRGLPGCPAGQRESRGV